MKKFFAVALVVLMAACSREQRVVIVSTNDIHSSIDNFPRLATLVDGLRIENGGDVLLVDAGDRWTGNPFVDLATPPLAPIVELMNELGYDVATLGNHEFDWGQTLLHNRTGEMNFPVVCANLESRGSELGYIPPYAIIETGGVRFAFLGLVTNFTQEKRPEGKAEHFEGLTFPDVFETAGKYAWLRDSCDVFVGLTHIGYGPDTLLAHRTPGLDLIVGGHSHTLIDKPLHVGGTLVTQTGGKLRYAGVTTVTKKRDKITIENRLVALDTIPPMPYFEGMVKRYNDNPELLAPIGETEAAFDKWGVRNLVTDAIRSRTKADVALYHAGGIRIDTLAGGVNTADLYRIEPFMSEIYTLHMTPGQIKGLILNKFNDTINPREAHYPDIMPSGLGYTISTDEAGNAVDVIFDRPERASYLVAMPDYLYKSYRFDRTENAVETGLQVTSILHDHIASHIPLPPDNTPRVVIE